MDILEAFWRLGCWAGALVAGQAPWLLGRRLGCGAGALAAGQVRVFVVFGLFHAARVALTLTNDASKHLLTRFGTIILDVRR